jgi:asparagine synthase (glutamine-hydrolysing)
MKLPETKEEWETRIKNLRKEERIDNDSSREELAKGLAKVIEDRIVTQGKEALTKGKIGLLFSGGVDSTLIAFVLQKHKIPFTAVTIGFQDDNLKEPEDITEARKTVEKIKIENYKEKILDYNEIERIFEETIKILGKELANAVNVGVGSVEVAGIKELLKINPEINQIFGGLGSEEIFAGYLRHKQASDKHEECWRGLNAMFERDLLRDFAIAENLSIEFWVPFLSEDVISFAMNIPVKYKLEKNTSKIILRESAEMIGLPKELAHRPKRAAQYGSRTDKALSKIAHHKKYKYKKEYIQSLLAEK